MNLQVIDLIEGFDMDVVYDCDTQLDKPHSIRRCRVLLDERCRCFCV
jgi:hypothetical protein